MESKHLTPAQIAWLRAEAEDTFGLTKTRADILVGILERDRFGLREIARLVGMTPERVRDALDAMVARELVEVRLVGKPRSRNAFEAIPGPRLSLIIQAVTARIAIPA